MRLTVIIPTHRQKHLACALEGLARQSEPGFEVLVVENGVRDHSARDLCSRFSSKLKLRYAYSSAAGLNRARNLGVQLARHALIALLDDDCEPARDWARTIVRTHAAFPEAGAVGGPVTLSEHPAPPAWLVGRFREMLSELRWGKRQKWLGKSEWLCGANLSFRRELHDAVGGFPEDFGMVGRNGPQLGNDEIVFLQRVLTLPGRLIRYHPGIAVTHRVGRERMTIEYLESRSFGQGYSDLALEQLMAGDLPWPQVWRRALWALPATHWFSTTARVTKELRAQDRRLHAVNLLRARVAYLNGLRERCLAPDALATTPRPRTTVELRCYAAGARTAARLRRSLGRNGAERLEFVIRTLGKRRVTWARSDEASAATAFCRIAFVSGIVDRLFSRQRGPLGCDPVARPRQSERFLERMLFSGGPRRRRAAAAVLDWSRESADDIIWSPDHRRRSEASGFAACIFTHDPFPISVPVVSVRADGTVVFSPGGTPGKCPVGEVSVPDRLVRALTDMFGEGIRPSDTASVAVPLDHLVAAGVLEESLGMLAAVAAGLRRRGRNEGRRYDRAQRRTAHG